MKIRNLLFILVFSFHYQIKAGQDTLYSYTVLADGLDHPWSMAVIDDNNILFTELSGQLRQIREGRLMDQPVSGVPDILFKGQGGLSGITLDPEFNINQTLYLAFSSKKQGSRENTLKVIRARLVENKLIDVTEIFSAYPYRNTALHYGAKITFMEDGTLLITNGDGFNYREKAQTLDNHFGKIVRINKDGTIPIDNPYINDKDKLPEIWSYGHRNPQGIVNVEGIIFGLEHGPMGGDELNIINSANNYGWPAITYGRDYNGSIISPFTEMKGMEQPVKYWVPSIAPSGIMHYDKEAFPAWEGSLFVSYLKPGGVIRLVLDGTRIKSEEVLFDDLSRIRDISKTPSGSILIATDGSGGEILRVDPR